MIVAPPPPNLFYLNHLISSSDMGCGISRASLSAAVLSRGRSFGRSGEFSSASASAADGGGGGGFKNNSNNNKTGELETGDSWVCKGNNNQLVDQRSPPLFLKEQSMEGEFLDWKRVDCKSIKKEEREWENRVIWSNVEDQNRDDREDSIWVCPGSPSFRVYCVDNDLLVHPSPQSITIQDHSEEEKENSPINPIKEHSKELRRAHRRGRIGRGFKTIQRGGSNGMKHLLNVSCRISSPTSHPHHPHHRDANAKPVVMEESIN